MISGHQSGNEYGRRLDILQNVVKVIEFILSWADVFNEPWQNQQEQKSTLKANPHSDASQTRRIDITTRLRARQSDTPVSNIIVGRLTKTTTAGQDETVKMGQNTESAKELNENKVKKYINLGNTDIVEDGDSQELKGDMMERWTVNDVSMWLKTQGMGEFIDDFVSAEIDGSKIHSLVSENSLEKVIRF
uniref:SAM domain-containing protein n=1 Tax=Spongospora subterranea TaxID=70186 RepID=A0A0H5QZ93_9EUKA|eukprot:CRZ07031.1 hypothetical protein [Spongospora subterranea]